MDKKINILFIAQEDTRILLMVQSFQTAGYQVMYDRVDSEAGLLSALKQESRDVILFDYIKKCMGYQSIVEIIKSQSLNYLLFAIYESMGCEEAFDLARSGFTRCIVWNHIACLPEIYSKEFLLIKREADYAQSTTSEIVLQNIADGVISTNLRGDVVFMNEEAERLTGWDKKNASTQKIADVFQLISGESNQPVPDIIDQVMMSGKRTGLLNHTMLVTKDNKKRYLSANISPIRTISGQNVGAVAVFRDISRLKAVEADLKDSEEKFKNLFNNVTDTIFVFRGTNLDQGYVNSLIIEVNDTACRLLGYSRDELLTMNPGELAFPGQPQEQFKFMENLRSHNEKSFEAVLFNKSGDEIETEIYSHSFVLRDEIVVMAIARDVTGQKKAKREVRKAIEATQSAYNAKSEFLANMSHEIRTPLNGIIGMIDLCLLTPLNDEQKDNIVTAKSCASSLLNIINDILDFSKLEAGKMVIEHIPFDLKERISKLGKVHYYCAVEKGLDLTCTICENIPEIVYGDPNRLEQVINNLLSNAVKFTESGSVSLDLSIVHQSSRLVRARFSIKDSGIGIAEEDIDKLFRSFTQVDGSHTRKYGGTGLGLVISKQLINSLGGILNLSSKKGLGSTFSFELVFDIAEPSDHPSFETDKIENLKRSITKANVLLVEDDKINQLVISRMLNMLGYSCEIAGNGLVALEYLSRKPFDLCLMDIQMPEMDGLQAISEIRKNEAGGDVHLPVIALTAYALQGDKERFMQAGMDDYLSKPLGIHDLGSRLQQVYNRFKGRQPGEMTNQTDQVDRETKQRQFILDTERSLKNLGIAIEHEDISSIEKYAHDIQTQSADIGEEYLKMDALRIVLLIRKGNVKDISMAYQRLSNQWNAFLHKH